MSNQQQDREIASPQRWFWPRSLSGKLLLLTTFFIMLTEILVFIPSVSNYRLTWLARHFTTGEAAALALESFSESDVSDTLRERLLNLTETEIIAIRRKGSSRILATRQLPRSVDRHIRLIEPGQMQAVSTIMDAFDTLIFGGDRYIRVFGKMRSADSVLELVMSDRALRNAMLIYARNVLFISLAISLTTALLVFFVLRWFMIRPLQNMTNSMNAFSGDPENVEHIIQPSYRQDEIGDAEIHLSQMQKDLSGTMKQQRHLADLGLAVSKINHDLRNILASASLFSDRLASSADPTVQRIGPRLVRALDRAVDYTRAVLAYGKAGEAIPKLRTLRLHRLAEDVAEMLSLDLEEGVEWQNLVDPKLEIAADPEQMFRVLVNLCRNAVQIMLASVSSEGVEVHRLTIAAESVEAGTIIRINDTGPGFSAEARERLFSPFQKSGRNGGTGLGLAIARELVKAHGGSIELSDKGEPGAQFEIHLPNEFSAK